MRILVLQHIACEPPAVYEDVMVERGCEIYRVELDEGETMPGWDLFDGIVAMGGPMGAYDENEHPWLTDEKTAHPRRRDRRRAVLRCLPRRAAAGQRASAPTSIPGRCPRWACTRCT